ncbi:hypothetical protein [Paracoccus sp. SSK6]|uniref:hypothetical protein n=1 Tax=Paracoccus sp. SSK6 TaxID=3143131 RepID=UPI00321B526E
MIRHIGGENQAKAAKILGLSRTTVSAAYNGGQVSQATARKIRSGYATTLKEDAKNGAKVAEMTAGTWAVGLPETRSADPEIRGECVVSHLREPAFSLHVEIRYGKDADEPEMTLTRVTGKKTGLGVLVETAREKALSFISRQNLGEQDVRMIGRLQRQYAGKGFSLREARSAKWSDLLHTIDELSDDDLEAARGVADRLGQDAKAHRRALGDMTDGDNEAYEAGRAAGLAEMREQIIRELLAEGRRSEMKPVGMLMLKRQIADRDTVRGGRRSDQQVNKQIDDWHAEVREELLKEGIEVSVCLMPEGLDWPTSLAVSSAISEAVGTVAIASGTRAKQQIEEAKEAVKTAIRSVVVPSSFRGDEQEGDAHV